MDEDGNELPRKADDPFALHNFSRVFPAHDLTPATMPYFRGLAVEVKTLFNDATSSDVYEGDTVNIHVPGATGSTNTSRSTACVLAPSRSRKATSNTCTCLATAWCNALPRTVQRVADGSGVVAQTAKGEPGSTLPKMDSVIE